MDRRLTPFSGRVAHISLKGQIEAERFTEGTPARAIWDTVNLFAEPDLRAREITRQLRMGDPVTVLDHERGLAFVRNERDGYCGWARAHELNEAAPQKMTHELHVRSSHLYRWPNMKTSGWAVPVSLGARVHVVSDDGRFARVLLPKPSDDHAFEIAHSEEYFIPSPHLRPLSVQDDDPVSAAERLVGTPYLWGGNSAFGIDCSGLVQLALQLCGRSCAGDSDMQEGTLGQTLPPGTPPLRGDLMFWKGHVAWVAGPDTLLHANAHHMAVAFEPLKEAVARIAGQGDGAVTRHARL